ncbi:hypothetical protein DFH94DRAFT_804471 [Russula ochroleuca]|uniref:NACHT domain-containing protein n=1 Tax=Russula ochroleuca TaxID=152965 RepID=A0A9P5MRY6_9AGAM|nr:hypothetical protein DFH94DRAFT_804471 [Russula ochroleuca]
MTDTITTIMVEVLSILAIATKEIKQGRTKKYLKKLIRRTEVEDGLKRLDKLMQEEARMATAQVLKAMHTVDDRVREVTDKVIDVDNRVAGVDNRVARVDDWVAGINTSVAGVNDRVARVNDKVAGINDRVTGVDNRVADGKEARLVIDQVKSGSGKSILCSSVIQDVQVMCDADQALMAYFYFDFRNISKQHCVQQPTDDTLTQSLKEMLTLPDQHPVYLIMDALDECSNISGIPSPRDQVLQLVKELVNLHVPHLHICVTSRPEVDIQDVLNPLSYRRVSLHDQSGQKKDIEDYIKSIVYSDSEPIMRRWRKEDKDLVIETLSEQADGMELPESLDETYERILKEIKKPNRGHAQCVLECLVVAIRPLRVAELAEVLAVDFDDAEGIPKLNADWQWEDQEQALLIACSTLAKHKSCLIGT